MSPVAVVTGAARGIGAATVDRLVGGGWHVVAVDACAPTIRTSTTRWRPRPTWPRSANRHGERVHTLVGDVRRPVDMAAAVQAAVSVFGGLDAAVAVAGVMAGGVPLWEHTDAQWNVQFDVNVHGVRNLATAAVPVLLLEAPAPSPGPGRGGVVGRRSARPAARLSGYSASKHAVIGLIKALAADLAGHGDHRQRGLSRFDPHGDPRRVGGRLRLPSPEEFAHQQLVRAPARARRAGRPHRLALCSRGERRDRRRALGRRRA
jgi:NAD(P)-dependent dehydrogenase (short-subunit alcohol dehydrogenase family)